MAETASGSSASTKAIIVIAVVVGGAALWWLRGILTPLILALFLMVLIDGFARVLDNRIPGFPKKAAMPVALVVSILLFGLVVYLLADNTRSFVTQLVESGPRLHERIFRLAGQIGLDVPPTLGEAIQRLNPGRFIGPVAQNLQNLLTDAIFVLIYLGFLLASRHGFNRKIVTLFPTHDRRDAAVHTFSRIRNGVERYVWVQTVTGALMALLAWGLMAALGLNNAFFWAFFIFIAAYIPMIGAAVSILVPALFALVQFETYWQAGALLVGLELIFFVTGNVILPKMQGDSLNLDPVAVLLGLAFWSAIWGLPGAFLAAPLLVITMVVLVQFRSTRWIAVLLSENGCPETDSSPDPSEPPAPAKAAKARKPRVAPNAAGKS